jgi:hypothetical protein
MLFWKSLQDGFLFLKSQIFYSRKFIRKFWKGWDFGKIFVPPRIPEHSFEVGHYVVFSLIHASVLMQTSHFSA